MKKSILLRLSAILVTAFLLLGLLPMGIFAAELELSSDGEGGYYLNMPAGVNTLDLTDKSAGFSFKLYDEGGAEGNYGNDFDGTLIITAPAGTSLSVSGSGEAEIYNGEGADWLTLYDGDTASILGEAKYSGSFTVDEMITGGNVLKVYFCSDYAIPKSGFELTVTIVDTSSLATLTFTYDGASATRKASPGAYTMPSFATMFTLPMGKSFSYWQGGAATYEEGDEYTVTGDAAFTAVLIDNIASLSYDDEGGYYVNMPATGDAVLDVGDQSLGFNFTVYDDGGPDENYSNHCSGYLVITAPEGAVLSISGSGKGESTKYDWLTFYDGDLDTVLGDDKYGGKEYTIETLVTTGNVLIIYSKSDGSQNYDGFALTVTVLDASDLAFISFTYIEETKTVTVEKNKPYTLPEFTELFTLPWNTVFIGWECGGTTYEAGDTVAVNGDMAFTAAVEYGEVLHSDGEGGYYALVPPVGTVPLDLSDKSSGFTFKVYDDGGPDENYSNDCDGYLAITAPEGTILTVSGSGKGESTTYDWLTFYNGNTDTVLGNAKYGGSDFTVDELITSGSVLIIYFRTDGSQNYSGFALTVTILDASNLARVSFTYGSNTKTVNVDKSEPYILPEFSSLFTPTEGETFCGWQEGEDVYAAGDSFDVTGDTAFTAVIEIDPVLYPDGHGGWYTKTWRTTDRSIDLSDKSAGFTFKVYDDGGPDGNYSFNCSSYMTLTAPVGTAFTISGSGLGESTQYDWLTFYNGNTDTVLGSPKYGEYEYTIDTLATTGNVLIIYFHSDNAYSYEGFELTVTIVDLTDLSMITFAYHEETRTVAAMNGGAYILPEFDSFFTLTDGDIFSGWQEGEDVYAAGDSIDVSGNTTFTAIIDEEPDLLPDGEGGWYTRLWKKTDRSIDLSGKPAGFTFKIYDDGGPDGNYSDYCDSCLTLIAPEGTTFKVSGTGASESTVDFDWLTIYDGITDAVLGSEKYGGTTFTVEELHTTGNVLNICFISDYTWTYEGFELTVTIEGDALRGDINRDGSVTISDVTALLDVLSGQDEPDIAICDLSGDGDVTIADVTTLLDMLSGGVS